LVAYDITSNKLRRKLEKLLCGYGVRLQYSLFQCPLNDNLLREMRSRLEEIMVNSGKLREQTDSVIIIGAISEGNFDYIAGAPCIINEFLII
jgi:CRISPR-associated endonuclease Cas2